MPDADEAKESAALLLLSLCSVPDVCVCVRVYVYVCTCVFVYVCVCERERERQREGERGKERVSGSEATRESKRLRCYKRE